MPVEPEPAGPAPSRTAGGTARIWWRRLGGPHAYTWWSWGITAPAVVGLSGMSVVDDLDRGFAMAGTAVIHVLLGALLALARVTVIGPRRTGRPALTLAIFAAASGLKPFAFDALSALAGHPLLPDLPARVMANMIPGTVMLAVIAIAVDAARTRQQVEEHLTGTLAAVTRQAEDDDLRVATMREDVATALRARLEAALGEAPGGADPGTAAATLVTLAEQVVRPFAHALFEDPPPAPLPRPRTTAQRYVAALTALAPPHPVIPVALFLTASVPHLLMSGHTLGPLAVAGVAMALAHLATSGAVARLRRPWPRVVAALGASVLVAGAGLVTWLVLTPPGAPTRLFLATLACYPLIAVGVSLVQTADRARDQDHELLAAALVERTRAAACSRERLLRARQQVALVMHSTVQSELFGAALRLSEDAEPVDLGEVVRRAVELLRSRRAPQQTALDRLTGLIDAWGTSRRVERDLEPAAVDLMEGDDDLADRVVDVVSEALVNAARHASRSTSGGADITVRLRAVDGEVVVAVTSPGAAAPRSGEGLGLVHVEQASRAWRISERDGAITLEAELAPR